MDREKWILRFYNSKVEDATDTENYYMAFDNFDDLLKMVRKDDYIEFNSSFSLFGVSTEQWLAFQNKYGVHLYLRGTEPDTPYANLLLHLSMANMDMLYTNRDKLLQLAGQEETV